jgi:hypothetical protein
MYDRIEHNPRAERDEFHNKLREGVAAGASLQTALGGANRPSDPKPMPEVPNLLECLAKEMAALEETVRQLFSRLAPVRRPLPPAPGEAAQGQGCKPVMSAVGEELRNRCAQLATLRRDVREVIDELQV